MANGPLQEDVNKDPAQQTPHQSSAGKKVDGDPEDEKDKPADEDNLITLESQKGKKVDGDPEEEADQPTAVE